MALKLPTGQSSAYVLIASGMLFATTAVADESVRFVAVAVGVTPDALAAAGCDSSDVHEVLQALDAAEGLRQLYDQYLDACDANAAIVSSYAVLVSEASPSSEDRDDLIADAEAAEETFQDSIAGANSRRDALEAVALNGLSSARQAKVQAFTAAAIYNLPDEFRVLSRTAEQWAALEAAIRAEARAARINVELDQATQDLLNDTRSDSDVVAAKSGLNSNLDSYISIFETY